MHKSPYTRREFLKTGGQGLGLLAFSQWAPLFLTSSALAGAPQPEKDRTILVLIQLAGGNDGLNTCVPYQDPRYYDLRPNLALREDNVLKISDETALHASCRPLHTLLREGKLSIIQNVGYPNPNRSHFRSTEIWETASDSDHYARTGWLGRYFDNACAGAPGNDTGAGSPPAGVHLGNEVPQAFLAEHPHAIHGMLAGNRARRQRRETAALLGSLLESTPDSAARNASFLQHTMLNALATDRRLETILSGRGPGASYPDNGFGQSLASICALIAGGLETRVYFATLGGFDTHSNQATTHANLLQTLAEGLAAFQRDLEQHRLADQVLTMTFSEFGRRPKENHSAGTDHGTAAPLFVMGSRIRGGLFGEAPRLDIDDNADLDFTTDFRQIYATVLDRWLDCDSARILGRAFPPVGFL